MTKIIMCFEHQVAVKAFFVNRDEIKDPAIIKYLRSDPDGILEIPLDGIKKGKWKITLEWNYEGKDYSLVKDVVIPIPEKAET